MIDGICDPNFKVVRDALAQNLSDEDEIGETVSVVIGGRTVVTFGVDIIVEPDAGRGCPR